jgi:hypothetical protein
LIPNTRITQGGCGPGMNKDGPDYGPRHDGWFVSVTIQASRSHIFDEDLRLRSHDLLSRNGLLGLADFGPHT